MAGGEDTRPGCKRRRRATPTEIQLLVRRRGRFLVHPTSPHTTTSPIRPHAQRLQTQSQDHRCATQFTGSSRTSADRRNSERAAASEGCYSPRIHTYSNVQISITMRTTAACQMEYGGS
jgi:hypothetical protein